MRQSRRVHLPKAVRTAARSVIATILTVVLLLAVVLFETPLCTLKKVDVRGTQVLSREEVIEQAELPMGEKLALIDTHVIASRVASLPRVKRVKVEPIYPNALRITITERVSVAYLRVKGQFYEVDAEGIAMKVLRRPAGLPEVVFPNPLQPSLQGEAALLAAQHIPPDIARRIKTINATSAAMIILYMRDGRIVELGSANNFDAKMSTLRIVLTQPGRIWNISNPELPTRR